MDERAADPLRIAVVALARTDRGLTDATLQSIARLDEAPAVAALVVPRLREHQFADAAQRASLRLVTTDSIDVLALADGFRAVASDADIVMFVPEGVVLAPGYLAAVRATAERWQDVVGEIDVVHAADETWLRALRPRTLCAAVLWTRVEACGSLKFASYPQTSEYLAFAVLLDQLRPRGRTGVTTSHLAVQVRTGPERRSGFDAGHELYAALTRLGRAREGSDMAFENRRSHLQPEAEKLRLFGEEMIRYLAVPETRAHVGSFLHGMWAARREAAMSRHRLRSEIRKLR